MRTDYLYEFIQLTKNENFQTTADALFISQSTLSKHIQAIEAELGFALTSHNKNKFVLTPEGMEFLPYAQKMCDLRNEYTTLFKNRAKTMTLDIGTCHFTSIEDRLFSDAILQFSTEYPDCLIRTPPVMATDNIDEMLTDNERARLSCVIAKSLSTETMKFASSLINCSTILEWPISVLTRHDHPLAGRPVTLADIEKEELISLAYPTFANALAVKAFRSEGLIPIFSNTLNSFQSICDFVENGKGIYVVSEPVEEDSLPENLCLTKIVPEIYSETIIACSSRFNREYEKHFLEILKEKFSQFRL